MTEMRVQPPPVKRYTIGCDLGQAVDPTAVCVLEENVEFDFTYSRQAAKVKHRTLDVRHLERLEASSRALGLGTVWSERDARAILGRLLGDRSDGLARFYRTGGAGGSPVSIAWVEPPPPWTAPHTPPWRLACHAERIVPYLPAVKHTNRLAHARARRDAHARGFDDAILVHRDGWALEGSASNLFFFESDTLHTPALECGILPGITRDTVLELAPACGFRVVEGRYPPEIVTAAREQLPDRVRCPSGRRRCRTAGRRGRMLGAELLARPPGHHLSPPASARRAEGGCAANWPGIREKRKPRERSQRPDPRRDPACPSAEGDAGTGHAAQSRAWEIFSRR